MSIIESEERFSRVAISKGQASLAREHFMHRKARWIAIVACLFIACAALQAAPTTQKHPRKKSAHHRTVHHYRHSRHYRRHYYRHRVRLPRGPSPERITQIQTALSRGGYYKGDTTGRWDSNTVAALQKFQSAHSIVASGKLDAPTLQKLGLGSDIAGVAAPKTVVPKGCCSAGPAIAKPAAPAPVKVPANATDSASATGSQPATRNSSKPTSGGSGASSTATIAPSVNPSAGDTSDAASSSKSDDSQH